jgi:hypothetical protein
MKGQQQTAVAHLAHALVFVRLAKETEYPEMRQQHLDEAERLIEYAKGILEGPHGVHESTD